MQYLCNSSYSKDAMAFLDFGGIQSGIGNGSYGNCGTIMFGGLHEPLSNIVGAVESYALGWYQTTSSCPALNIVVGTNNSTFCGTSTSCSSTGGAEWAAVINSVNTWLSNEGMLWQVAVLAGDDIESWGPPGPAKAFVDAYSNAAPPGELINVAVGTTSASG
jgi:hypothetical protein